MDHGAGESGGQPPQKLKSVMSYVSRLKIKCIEWLIYKHILITLLSKPVD